MAGATKSFNLFTDDGEQVRVGQYDRCVGPTFGDIQSTWIADGRGPLRKITDAMYEVAATNERLYTDDPSRQK